MPEGDSVAGHARKLRAMFDGEELTSIDGSAPSVRTHAGRLRQGAVSDIRTHGKHLLVDFTNGWTVHVHLGMNGRWRFLTADQPIPGSSRLVLSTARHHAACLGAPTVEVKRTPDVDTELARLGPDLLKADFDTGEFIRRIRLLPETPIGELLLNQRVLAGIGNVYKSELLFLFRLHPNTPTRLVSDSTLTEMASRVIRLLTANAGPRPRTTTGDRSPGRRTWVYGRRAKPCRRCGTPILSDTIGNRVTYWCPTCQPEPD